VFGVRRLIMIVLCLCGIGLLLLLLARPRRQYPGVVSAPPPPPITDSPPAPVPSPDVAAPLDLADPPDLADSPDPPTAHERTLQMMAELRASIIDGVSRRSLYLLAVERGLDREMFVASSWDLLDAILRVEGLSPELRDASPDAVQRLQALADEAFAREQEERRQSLEHYDVYRRFWGSSSA
jgi:hypothetical protein